MYALFMSPCYLTFWKLDLNISLETPGEQRSASVTYSSSTRHNKNTTSVMIIFTGENNNWNLLIIKWNGNGINKLNHVITSCSHTQVHDYFIRETNVQESDEKTMRF